MKSFPCALSINSFHLIQVLCQKPPCNLSSKIFLMNWLTFLLYFPWMLLKVKNYKSSNFKKRTSYLFIIVTHFYTSLSPLFQIISLYLMPQKFWYTLLGKTKYWWRVCLYCAQMREEWFWRGYLDHRWVLREIYSRRLNLGVIFEDPVTILKLSTKIIIFAFLPHRKSLYTPGIHVS